MIYEFMIRLTCDECRESSAMTTADIIIETTQEPEYYETPAHAETKLEVLPETPEGWSCRSDWRRSGRQYLCPACQQLR